MADVKKEKKWKITANEKENNDPLTVPHRAADSHETDFWKIKHQVHTVNIHRDINWYKLLSLINLVSACRQEADYVWN